MYRLVICKINERFLKNINEHSEISIPHKKNSDKLLEEEIFENRDRTSNSIQIF